jgi:hypothetical protein
MAVGPKGIGIGGKISAGRLPCPQHDRPRVELGQAIAPLLKNLSQG